MAKANLILDIPVAKTPMDAPERTQPPPGARRIGYVDGAIGDPERITFLSSLFASAAFESVGPVWPEHCPQHLDVLFVSVDGGSGIQFTDAIRRLKLRSASPDIVVVLRDADATNTRLLVREGAADVLPVPASDAILALSLERLLARNGAETARTRRSGQVVALLKAGGGVGATSLGVQVTGMLASRANDGAQACFADFDLQFGCAALYFDFQDILTVADCLPIGDALGETQFDTALASHGTGARVLAAPRQLTPLDVLNPQLAEGLINGLRRDFALTIVDLPSVWTTWTNRILQLADRIVLVTQLSVPHVHLTRRQLSVLAMQKLDEVPLLLVCNALSSEQQKLLPIKSAQRALGHEFDHVIPEDHQTMNEATSRGAQLSAIRRGTKIEKAIGLLASAIASDAFAGIATQSGR